MASTILSDNGVSSGSAGIKSTADSTGALALQTTTAGGAATTAITIDTSQNVGIGTTSPSTKLDVNGTINIVNGSSVGGGNQQTKITGTTATNIMQFYNAASESMRLDNNNNLLIGCTSQANAARATWQTATNNSRYIGFQTTAGAEIGYIFNNTTATQYSTTSDYRLKQDVVPMTGALAKVAALKPVTYKWKFDNSDGEGFIAHELQEVCPHAVVGQKDEVNFDGNPVYQGIDTSFLVATLTAAIQEQQALITALTARVAALEAK